MAGEEMRWSAYAELRRSVDELEVNLLEVPARGVDHERLADGNDALLGAGDGPLEHQVVILNDTVVREATHRCDLLLRDIMLSRRIAFVTAGTNAINLLVELGTVVVTV